MSGPPPIQNRPAAPPATARPVGPPPAAAVFDRYSAEYRIRRRMQATYAGVAINHPHPGAVAGPLASAAIEAMLQGVLLEVEAIVAGRPAVEPREVRDDPYLPDDSDLFRSPKRET